MKYKDVIWDWNGTLINDATLCADVLDFMMRSRGLGGIRLEEYRENFRFPISDFYKDMGFDLSSSNFEEIGAEFILQYTERRFKCSLHDGAGKCIAKLKSIGVRQSILSASQKDDLATAVKHFGISEYSIRMGIRQGMYPAIKIGGKRGKYLIDAELFESTLRIEAIMNMKEYRKGEQNHDKN